MFKVRKNRSNSSSGLQKDRSGQRDVEFAFLPCCQTQPSCSCISLARKNVELLAGKFCVKGPILVLKKQTLNPTELERGA
ncbi:hypothetical protein Mapa_006313 [Marchantia paleacea]|nr:hypothetical protein Mapa_006313 [Marchantia paleacea]